MDARRDVAAIRIAASRLPVQPWADLTKANAGDPVTVIANPAALPWSVSNGVVSATRLADEVPGAGQGYRLLQFTASSSPGSSGGVVLDSRGAALGLVVGELPGGQNLYFTVPFDAVLGLADAAQAKNFANGANLALPSETGLAAAGAERKPEASLDAPERSDSLPVAKDPATILKGFKTMFVDARKANHFRSEQLKAALGRNKGFSALNARIVDDYRIADVARSPVIFRLHFGIRTPVWSWSPVRG